MIHVTLSFSSVTTKILFNGKIILSIGFSVKLNNVPVLCCNLCNEFTCLLIFGLSVLGWM